MDTKAFLITNMDAPQQKNLRKALEQLGFVALEPAPEPPAWGSELRAQRQGRDWIIEAKAVVPYRRKDLLGALAHSLVRVRDAMASSQVGGLVAVWLKKRSPTAVREAERFLSKHAPDVGWLLVDARGWMQWKIGEESGESHGPPKDGAVPLDPTVGVVGDSPAEIPRNPFSPVNQWILKVLLLSDLDPGYWGGPRGIPSGGSELAELCGASQSQVSKLLAYLREKEHLVEGAQGMRLHGLRRFIDDWASYLRRKPRDSLFAKPVHPAASREEARKGILEGLKRCGQAAGNGPEGRALVVGSHLACHLLGLGHSNLRSMRLYVAGPIQPVLERLGLVAAREESAVLEIEQPRASEAAMRGAVDIAGLHVADVLQCYLDVSASPARGEEQADYLWRKALSPYFEGRGWS